MSTNYLLRSWPSPRSASRGSLASYVVMLHDSSTPPTPQHEAATKTSLSGEASVTHRGLFPMTAASIPMGTFHVGPPQDDIAVYPGTPSPPVSATPPSSGSSPDYLFMDAVEEAVEIDDQHLQQSLQQLEELDQDLILEYPPSPVVAPAPAVLPEEYVPDIDESHMPPHELPYPSNYPTSAQNSPANPPSPALSPAPIPDSENSELQYPMLFDGKKEDVMLFLSQCYAHLAAHPREHRTDDDKISFILTRFRGIAATIYGRPVSASLTWHGNFSAFISEFLEIFDGPDSYGNAEDQLRLLRMSSTEEIGPFLREFEDLLNHLGWSESAKCHALHHALPLRLSMELDECVCYPSTYPGLRAMLTRLDTKYWATQPAAALAEARRNAREFWGDHGPGRGSPGSEDNHGTPSGNDLLDRGGSGPREASPALSDISPGMPSLTSIPVYNISSSSGTPVRPTTGASGSGDAGPSSGYARKAVDPSRKRSAEAAGLLNNKGKLRKEEAERRRRLGLCMYCGSGGHHIGTCQHITRVVHDKRQRTGESRSTGNDS